MSDVRKLYETFEFDRTKGTVRLEEWPEGLVLWVGGSIAWKSWGTGTVRQGRFTEVPSFLLAQYAAALNP